jgi:hypothetical protein
MNMQGRVKMSVEQSLKLSFSERIRLRATACGIQKILNAVLKPEVSILIGDKMIDVHGRLMIRGHYEPRTLTNVPVRPLKKRFSAAIPLKISLPIARVQLNALKVEIDQFSYQLCSNNELDVEVDVALMGVLDQEPKVTSEHAQVVNHITNEPDSEELVNLLSEPQVKKANENDATYQAVDNVIENENNEGIAESDQLVETPYSKKWGKWFNVLDNKMKSNFSAMRMVVVQKEESVEQFAAKADVLADRIVRLSGKTNGHLQVGEIVEIESLVL